MSVTSRARDGARALSRMELPGRLMDAHPDASPFGPGVIARLPGVRPGFSGGPVLDDAGRLVGMIAAIRPAAQGEAPHILCVCIVRSGPMRR